MRLATSVVTARWTSSAVGPLAMKSARIASARGRDRVHVAAGADNDLRLEDAGALQRRVAGAGLDGEFLIPHEGPLQTRTGKCADDRATDVERRHLRRQQPGDRPAALDDGEGQRVLERHGPWRGKHRHPGHGRPVDGTARDRTEIAFDQRAHLRRGGVARHDQHGIVRAIFVAEPLLDVGQAGRVEIGHRADHEVVIGDDRPETALHIGRVRQARRARCRVDVFRSGRRCADYRAPPASPRRAKCPMRSLSMNSTRSSAPAGAVS